MGIRILQILVFVFSLFLIHSTPLCAQYKIRGTVYDSSRIYPVPFVSVLSTSGKGTITNNLGDYEIEVAEKDSIWFSYLNKPTVKFPVLKIATPLSFDISLQVNVPVLAEVKIRPRNYRQDSLQNREDYAKIFNYKKPGLSVVTPQYGVGAGFDINEIINVFRFRRNRSIQSFQDRLLAQEEEKFVDHRFSKGLVRRLTYITDVNELDSFMALFRPPYIFTVMTSDYDFQKYIKDSYERFKMGLGPQDLWRHEEEDR
ncbi:MAG: hypothetical protein ACSLE0_07705 [Chitinophagaceae bacterium]